MMKFTRMISFLLVVLLSIGVLASCAGNDGTTDPDALSYVSLRINPEVDLIVDANGVVAAANAINEDGEVVLCAVELEGKSVEEAGALFAQTANELGYVTDEKDTVYIGVESADEDEASELKEKLNKSVRDYFNNNGINGKVSAETLDKYADKAAEWGISVGHTKLVMRALDANPEMSDEEVLALSHKDLMKLLKGDKNEEKIAAGLRGEYRAEVGELKAEYANVFALRAEIEALESSLTDELSKEQKEAIEVQIAQKEAELKPISNEYKTKLNELKDKYKELSKQLRKEYLARADQKKANKKEAA